ncbi:MAG: peptidyl-alpha-hydroxyglycine alpha-amidating lyase family protein [Chloroflexota bacterium]|jgi:DNA-binding beta-propeller fold protein YncE|nr:peptidyl-alpha-hydroxyglycine alpha-amidating lyase family protein [Chloroflexota bacterium]|tara:strand:+ start:17 stop:1048 length:1032 start_codon:yes stop_codon:yes gene_type:complete
MTNKQREDWEFGLPTDGHMSSEEPKEDIILGDAPFKYSLSGKNWGNLPDGWVYKEATAVDVDSNDNVYVFNRGTKPVIVFNPDGDVIETWGDGIFQNPHAITIGPDNEVYCVDNGDSSVRKFNSKRELLFTLGTPGKEAPAMSGKPFAKPTHVAIDKRTGEFYVADGYANAVVHKYTPEGELQFTWGESGTDPGQFNIVHNICVDDDGWVYIADRENHRIQIFDSNGKFETQWVNMSRAATITLDSGSGEQLLYVGEYFSGIGTNHMGTNLGPRVSIYNLKGELLSRVGKEPYGEQQGRFYSPHGIAVDSKGDIYVAEVSYSDYGKNMNPPRELRSMQKLVRV